MKIKETSLDMAQDRAITISRFRQLLCRPRKLAVVIAVSLAWIGTLRAGPITSVDQLQVLGGAGLAGGVGVSVAQGFVPTLTGLDAVELSLVGFGGAPRNLSVNIRSGTASGPLLARPGSRRLSLAALTSSTSISRLPFH